MMRPLSGRDPNGAAGLGAIAGAEARTVAALEGRPVVRPDRPGACEASQLDPLRRPRDRRIPPADTPATRQRAHALRARGDLPRARPGTRAGCDRDRARARALDDQSRGRGWRRPQPCLLARNARLRHVIARKLALDWSPEQICGWLVRTYPDDKAMRVSTETIYRSLFIQARGVLKQELQRHLRTRRRMRRPKALSPKAQRRGTIVDAVSIRERPATAEDRAVPGHWEGDLLAGANNSHVATLVERRSRYLMLVKVSGKDTAAVVDALRRRVRTLPKELRGTLTWDRGKELADHKWFTVATHVQVYVCDPHSPWQRGTNENTNGLLRQYLPKKSNLSLHSQAELNAIARRINTRPRKTLAYQTPAAILERDVALTG